MGTERCDSGEGFRIGTQTNSNELVLHLSPSLAYAVGKMLWESLQDRPVDDRHVVLAAALCNLSEFMQDRLVGRASLTE